jgi:hypothetical protein
MKKLLLLLLLPCSSFGQSGIITTIAGNGQGGYSGDNGPALSAQIGNAGGMCFDNKGNFYIVQGATQNRIRIIDPFGIIRTFAGTGAQGFLGDNGPANNAQLNFPVDVACDSKGNIYIADGSNNRIRKVDTGGFITTFAGNGVSGYSGDNGAAIAASLHTPYGLSFDKHDNLYFADYNNHVVRKVGTTGVITTIAGTGALGFSGDNGPAVNAKLFSPTDVVVDSMGIIYIGDFQNNRVRKIDASGTITTIGGNGNGIYNGDSIPAITASISVWSLVIDKHDNLYIADKSHARIRKINLINGIITTVAGNGTPGFSGDNALATAAQLNYPEFLTVDKCGDLYISEVQNKRVRKVDLDSCKSTVNPNPESISTTHQKTFGIYPNPANDVLHIINIKAGATYIIHNAMGRILRQGVLTAGNNEIDIHSLTAGIYIIELRSEDVSVVGKFVKQ